jgi:hypothetical protein
MALVDRAIATPVTWDRSRFLQAGRKAKREHFHAEAELVNIMAIFSIPLLLIPFARARVAAHYAFLPPRGHADGPALS